MKHAGLRAVVLVFLTLLAFQAGAEEAAQAPATAVVGADGIQRLVVVGGSYFFKPNHIVVKVNIPVELTVSKESGLIPHDIAMESPEAGMVFDEQIGSDPKVIRFTPTKEGRYPFYCTKRAFFSTHREKGMEGVIEVVP